MRLTGAVFLDVAKAFYSVWVDILLYKPAILSFPSYLVKVIFLPEKYNVISVLSNGHIHLPSDASWRSLW
jgi:hypothetical protein